MLRDTALRALICGATLFLLTALPGCDDASTTPSTPAVVQPTEEFPVDRAVGERRPLTAACDTADPGHRLTSMNQTRVQLVFS